VERAQQPTDRELVAAIARGDAAALRTLNARYGRMLAALARRIVGVDSDAEEVAADVLWQAWRSAGSFDPARGSVSVWLVTLGRSRAIDRLRSIKARETRPETDDSPFAADDPGAEIDVAKRAVRVRAAVSALEANEKTALEMAYYSDLSQSEIADKLNIPLGTVKTRIRSAMIKLRKALATEATGGN
jgi:RNA polymerase sigma-70 factor, ECF subfamily